MALVIDLAWFLLALVLIVAIAACLLVMTFAAALFGTTMADHVRAWKAKRQ